MENREIWYKDIIDLGFQTEKGNDNVYFNHYGFQYEIITLWLTNTISVDYAKETRTCELIRVDNKEKMNIKKRIPIENLNHLKQIIDFFRDEYDYTKCA